MKLTVDRIENNIAFCEYTDKNEEVLYKGIPLSALPFTAEEGMIFSAEQNGDTWSYTHTNENSEESVASKERVRNKLNFLFNKSKK